MICIVQECATPKCAKGLRAQREHKVNARQGRAFWDGRQWQMAFEFRIMKAAKSQKSLACIGSGKIFFDVPVYRLSKGEYESRQEAFIQKEICDGNYSVQEMYRRNPDVKRKMENHLWESYGGSWLFNEIIGFIRLFFLSDQLRGEYLHVEAEKIVRTRRKVFSPLGVEITAPKKIPQGSSNKEIFGHIRNFLSHAQNERELRKRYVDTSIFDNIGPYVNWNAFLEEQFKSR